MYEVGTCMKKYEICLRGCVWKTKCEIDMLIEQKSMSSTYVILTNKITTCDI